VHKVAFELPFFGGHSLTIYWYGVLVAMGFLVGLWNASRRGARAGMSAEAIMDLGPGVLIGTLVGARALYVISYWPDQFATKPWWEMFMIHHGGLVYYGGLVGASLSFILYARWKKLPLWQIADVLAPGIALGQAIGRVGCLMNGCCYGKPTSQPWAIHFPPGHETGGAGVHPTELYESVLDFGLYIGLAWFYQRRRFDGQTFAAYLVCYAVLRSFVETFRGDYTTWYGGFLTPGQVASACILPIGLLLYWWLRAVAQAKGPGPVP
jgi:phosphatidylglycerol:prolipoprotein diacylglycerol transferase